MAMEYVGPQGQLREQGEKVLATRNLLETAVNDRLGPRPHVPNDRLRHRLIGYARASRVVAVKLEYAMSVNRAERDALANMLSGDRSRSVTCGGAGLGDGGDDDGGGEAEDDDSLERRRVPGRGRACSPRPNFYTAVVAWCCVAPGVALANDQPLELRHHDHVLSGDGPITATATSGRTWC